MLKRAAFPRFVFVYLLGAISGRAYAHLPARYGARYMMFCTICFGVMALGLWSAGALFAASYFRAKPLLQGVHIVGEVLQLNVKPYIPRGGRMEYETVVTYSFIAPEGRRATNTIRRTLIARPQFKRGGPIDLLYEPGNPDQSTMSTELARDLAQKSFGAWLFVLVGIYPALLVFRYLRWRRDPQAFDT